MYIIDRIEHGNGGVGGFTILDELPLEEALKKTPYEYSVYIKMWGFWPVISETKDINNYLYRWDEHTESWIKKSE